MPSSRRAAECWIAVFVFGMLVCPPLRADIDELYKLSIGTNITQFDTSVEINSRDGSISEEIDFEDDVGMDSRLNTGWISGWYRVGDNHRLKLTYIPFRRSAYAVSQNDIEINNSTIKAGAAISTDLRTDVFDFSYIYSLIHRPQIELGLSAGLYILRSDTQILAAGEVQAEGEDNPTFRSDFASSQRIYAPMPLIGLSLDYEFSSHWRTHASLRYLDVSIDEITGNVLAAELGLEYYFTRNWGLGASVGRLNIDVDVEGVVLQNAIKYGSYGAQIYGVFKY
jgi:hypothetical protein